MRMAFRYEGGDVFKVARAADRLQVTERFEPGDLVAFDLEKYRSKPQNNTMFACIAYAFENRREDRWVSAEHLRAWLFCKVDYKDVFTLEKPVDEAAYIQTMASVVAAVRKRDGFVFYREDDRAHYFDVAKSWQYRKLDHPDATAIMQAVLEVISVEVIPGMSPEQLVKAVKSEIALRKS